MYCTACLEHKNDWEKHTLILCTYKTDIFYQKLEHIYLQKKLHLLVLSFTVSGSFNRVISTSVPLKHLHGTYLISVWKNTSYVYTHVRVLCKVEFYSCDLCAHVKCA